MVKQLSEAEANLIRVVHELPPVKTLFFMSATPDQINKFKISKNYWQVIKVGLQAYFSGMSIKQALKEFIAKEPPQFLMLDIDEWLRFYDLINFGWDDIESYFEKTDYCLVSTYNDYNQTVLASPGDVIRFILEQKSYYSFAECLEPYYSFSPQTFYRDYKNWLKIKEKKISSKPLTKSEQKTNLKLIEKTNSNSRNKFKEGAYLQQLLIDILSKSRNRTVKKKLREYLQVADERNNELLKELHPSKKRKGHAWSKGKKLTGNPGWYS